MALISWDESLSVKVAQIDRQHKKLIDMINDLNNAMKQGKGKDVLGKILNGLTNYTNEHFKTEERYFEKFGYPEKEKHKMEHDAFVEKVTEFRNELERGKVTLSMEVMMFLSKWLRNHIKITDKKYSEFFNEKGLQ